MLISGTAPLKQGRHSYICESLRSYDGGSHMIFRPASGIAGGSKRKWQIQVECVTCLKRVIYLSPFL